MPQRFEDEVTFVDAVNKRPLEHTLEGLYEIEVKAMPRNVPHCSRTRGHPS